MHKWIFYALSVLAATIAAHESTGLFLLLLIVLVFCLYKRFSFLYCTSVILVGLLSFLYFSYEISKLHQPLELPATLTWTDEYKINGAKLRGFMKDSGGRNVYVTYEFKNEDEKTRFESIPLVGMKFEVMGVFKEPEPPAHQYGFNMKSYLKSKGSLGILEISDWVYLRATSSISQKISYQRYYLIQHIENTFPSSLIAETQSLLIGFQENVDSEMTRAYQKLGITHLFAISGLHIAIVSLIVFQGLLRTGVRRELATILLIVVLPIYGVLAGGAPSVWRAVLVVEFILLTQKFKKLSMDDALAISFIFFVFLEPWSIYQVGFQLSYLATVSLIYSSNLLNRFKSWLVQSFLITFVCQLIVYPLLLYHFYELSLSSLIANIVFVPLFSFIILPINIVLLIVSFLPGQIVNILFIIYEPLRESLSQFILWVQTIPHQMWIPGKPSLVLIVMAYISVFCAFYIMDKGAKLWKYCLVLFVPILLLQIHNNWNNQMKISFVSVGQGDCILVELPNREEIYLIDTGGLLRFEQEEWKKTKEPYEVGRQVVVPYLKGKGIHRIDKLIITHADSDHVEGAEEILKEIEVSEIHISPNSYNKDVMAELILEANLRGIPIIEQMAGYSWIVNQFSFQYLWPTDTNYEGNNDSLVLYVTNGGFQALFTGDLEAAGEEQLVRHYPQLKNITVLKAGHHGSKTSSSEVFVQKLLPQITIFSTGKNNRYGHPSKEVVERFQLYNLKTLNTAEDGTIEISVNKEGIVVFTSNSSD
ncbi:DNA internalization-related competence protein ComEC/Rec2 [Ureibacillus manganicus]|uniref:Competence protein ComE n=1 Tax=Ureibacillus manganicus DSM 26584 TaxID=1384049 RepID=A0A0A3I146_9BACL|nr:DNA internalization-related competence protein ComEC/Rec2 [Ureibacillus manganicus]KGR78561.1 competence protein ComE [Ureibacillus manganicus DSM 26584]